MTDVTVRAIRGATQLGADDTDEMRDAVVELVSAMLERNRITTDALISILFTATADLRCEFPAAAARSLDLGDVPLLCAQELSIEGALPRVVRLMAHVQTDTPRSEVQHVYLRGADVLRKDIAQ